MSTAMRLEHLPPLFRLAGPLILSSSSITIMQLIDALLLARHSSEAVAAMGPSSLAVILFQGLMFGTASYAGTFVAYNHGRGDARGILASTWLGIHTSLLLGALALAFAWPGARIFNHVGHEPEVARGEAVYFLICMTGSVFPVLSSALAGWLIGVGRAMIATWVTFAALAVNAVLDWGLILGHWNLPRLGIAGAALGTVTAQAVSAGLFLLLFARAGGLSAPGIRRPDLPELRRFLSLALPIGLRISVEIAAWTVFLVIVGRLGTVELAASSIAFRINGTAFFPAIGLGQAAGILVGHARGGGRDHKVPAIAWQSLGVCEAWMLIMAILFAVLPEELMALFAGSGPESAAIVETGARVLRFVAFYCLFDAANVMLGFVLGAAGDTRWVARAYVAGSGVFLALLWLTDAFMPSLMAEWTLATGFVLATALLWLLRFRSGAWRRMQVLQEKPAAA